MIQLTGTNACKLRDELWIAVQNKVITKKEITDRLCKIDIPEFLRSEIIQMVRYRYTERITDPVELAMEKAVNYHILKDILKQENE